MYIYDLVYTYTCEVEVQNSIFVRLGIYITEYTFVYMLQCKISRIYFSKPVPVVNSVRPYTSYSLKIFKFRQEFKICDEKMSMFSASIYMRKFRTSSARLTTAISVIRMTIGLVQ